MIDLSLEALSRLQSTNHETSQPAYSLLMQASCAITHNGSLQSRAADAGHRRSYRGRQSAEEILDGAVERVRLMEVGSVARIGDRHPRGAWDLARHVIGGG